jgi:mitochondrial fission protein ELM1
MAPPFRILILSDGRPGHFNLSEGIARALTRRRPGEVGRQPVRRFAPGRLAAGATNARLPARWLLSAIHRLDAAAVPACDVIVSAGAETLSASVALARLRGVPNIHYGSLRAFRPRDFSLVLTSYAGRADDDRVVFVAKPAPFDPADLGPPMSPDDWPDRRPRRVAIAIGGPAPDCPFEADDWAHLERLIGDLAGQGLAVTVTNSRRTPGEVSDRLASLAGPGGPIARWIDVRRPDAARFFSLLADADALLVTADSSSMVSEAVFARRPIVALAPRGSRLTPDETQYRAALAERGLTTTCALGTVTAADVIAALASLRPYAGNPLDDLAALIFAKLPALDAAARSPLTSPAAR